MSSVPPNMPPTVPPRYDKAQWRAYREQQKAAWRAQRDAWKAQRHAWKTQYTGIYGPRVPSIVGPLLLVVAGVIALLIVTGRMDASAFWGWYGQWWPLLLIGAGLVLLGEWALDMHRGVPVRRKGSFVGILIFLAILGLCAAGCDHFWQWTHNNFGDNDFFNTFGLPEHDQNQAVSDVPISATGSVIILNPRGDVSISASDQPVMTFQVQEVAYAGSDAAAKRIFEAEALNVAKSGDVTIVKSPGDSHGKVNLTIGVPRTAKVTIKADRGDVTASGLGTGIDVTISHGDVHLNTIAGPIVAHLAKGEFSARDIQGDVTSAGPCTDVTLADIKGSVALNCDYFGQILLERVSSAVHLHSRSDIQLAQLDGDLTLTDDSLNVTQAKGPIHVVTQSRDVDLSQIEGDSDVEDRDGTIRIAPGDNYNVKAKNSKGDVEITLPPNASATVSGQTHNGDVVTDFGLTVNGEQDKTVSGRIGGGSAHITLSTDNGDLRIKKGSANEAAPTAPAAKADPNAPNERHLKSSKQLPAQPVTQ